MVRVAPSHLERLSAALIWLHVIRAAKGAFMLVFEQSRGRWRFRVWPLEPMPPFTLDAPISIFHSVDLTVGRRIDLLELLERQKD